MPMAVFDELELSVLVLLDQLLLEHELIAQRFESLELLLLVELDAGQLTNGLTCVVQASL